MKYLNLLCFICVFGFLTESTQGSEFYSPYESMWLTFNFQGFNPELNDMELVADHLWRRDIEITESSFEVLFAAESNFSNSWNVANQPHSSLPMAHVATPFGSNIEVDNNSDNTSFRFYFNDETLSYSIFLLNNTGTNLLYNGGFEERGSLSSRAAYWQYNRPTRHGDFWGNARRAQQTVQITPRTGIGIGTIVGSNLAQGNTNGGFWQDAPAEPGLEYEAVMYYRRQDETWQADVKELKVEFFDFNFDTLLSVHTQPFEIQPVGADWPSVRLAAIAPQGAAWARVVLNFEGIGTGGTLWIDDVSFTAIEPSRIQDFNQWTGSEFDSCHSFSGWQICTGKVVAVEELVIGTETSLVNVARSGLALSLAPGSGNFVRSPLFPNVGTVRFWHRNGALLDEDENQEPIPIDPALFVVESSVDGVLWSQHGPEFESIELFYQPIQVSLNIPAPRFIRIRQTGGTGRLLIDDIEVTSGDGTPRFQPFEGWPTTETFGTHSFQNWLVDQGQITQSGAKTGFSAEVQGSEDSLYFVQSPVFITGHGEIRFSYARGNNGAAPASFRVERSEDGISGWTTLATVSNITSRSYSEFRQLFYETEPSAIRIVNQYQPLTEFVPVIILSEGFDGGSTPPDGWTFAGNIGTYANQFGEKTPSLRLDNSNAEVTTPPFANATNLVFWALGQQMSGNSKLTVQGRVGLNWNTLAEFFNIPGSGATYEIALNSNVEQIRFQYTKQTGNLALDDVVIQGVAGPGQPAQNLMLDDIEIRRPLEFRNQNFDSWPVETSLGTHTHQFWVVDSGLITPALAFSGNAGHLQITPAASEEGYFVDFEGAGETKGGWATGTVFLSGLEWEMEDVLIGTLPQDWKNGARSARLRGHDSSRMEMLEDVTNGIGIVSFGYRQYGSDAQVTWRVEYSTDGGDTWTQTGDDFMGGEEEATFFSLVNTPGHGRIRIVSVDGGSSNRRLNIDDILITDFDASSGPPAVITSPTFVTGIGAISFRYRHRLAEPQGDEILTLEVQTTTDGENWTTRGDPITVDTNEYQRIDVFIPVEDQEDAIQGRIRLIEGSDRVIIDDIQMGPPRPAASLILSSWTDPEGPFTNDTVRIVSRAVRRNGADDVELTLHYRFGSEGPFTNSTMSVDSGNYISDVEFPPLPRGSRVEYYIEAHFSGPGAISPVFYPAGGPANPAFYAIPRAEPGSVWINEVNIELPLFEPVTTYPFIELAGRAGTDIGGWSIVIQSGTSPNFEILGTYLIPESTLIANQHLGHGFFVFAGGTGAGLHDIALTNDFIFGEPLGIQLLNEAGAIEQMLSFNGRIVTYERGGNDAEELFGTDTSGALVGTGGEADDFEWGENQPLTPGAPNDGQTFEPFDPPEPDDDIEIINIDFSPSQITIWTDGNTGSWTLIPEYSTDLLIQPQEWIIVPGVTDTPSGTENTITFAPPATNRVMMFRIRR